ncbi:MAG: IS110 family transposase [Thermoleophilaceae bacterium]
MDSTKYTLGIDVACRAAHVATLTDQAGQVVWSNHRFLTSTSDLTRLWSKVPAAVEVTVVVEPTRNAWVPVAAWLATHGARIVLVPPEQSSDLRKYYEKHTKNDRLDSVILSRLPLLHPEGLTEVDQFGPTDPMRRAVRRRDRFVQERTRALNRLVALVELLGPGYQNAFPSGLHNKTAFAVLIRFADPRALKRFGATRLLTLVRRSSGGNYGEAKVRELLAAAHEAIGLYPGGQLDFAALAEDITAEIRTISNLDAEVARLDERIAGYHAEADPKGIFTSAPGVGPVLAPAMLGRIGDLERFANQASIRAFTGLVPSTAESGKWAAPGKITKAGDPGLRYALFLAANIARQIDPTLAAKYRRLVLERGHHHNSALCHLAATLITRLAACWKAGKPYEIRDLDGRVLTTAEGRQICADRYKLRPDERARIKKARPKAKTGQVTTGVA